MRHADDSVVLVAAVVLPDGAAARSRRNPVGVGRSVQCRRVALSQTIVARCISSLARIAAASDSPPCQPDGPPAFLSFRPPKFEAISQSSAINPPILPPEETSSSFVE